MSAPFLSSSAPRRHCPEPALAASDMDMEMDQLRVDATEWALLQHAWLPQNSKAFGPSTRTELIRVLETGLAEIEACLPCLPRPRRQM